ncbi:MAG: L-asparaginase 1 [Clostridiales bacterium]|nr:MAG: L-asparaginase 1 [Clostridiales bacterium]HJA30928.1 asparaginase [Candidatus Eisenbergiella pullicola]
MKKRILLLTTGGTIASGDRGSGLAPVLSSEDFLQYVREFETVCELVPAEVCSIDSTNMDISHWLMLARVIRENYEAYDGFLICHGTDTMAYTAAALSYLIQHSPKPIVLTGAQKSILSEITDARKNLHDSIRCALDDKSRDVMLVFDGKIIAGTRAKKTATFSYNAFSSINFPVIGRIWDDEVLYYIEGESESEPVTFYDRMDRKVFLLKLTPGMSAEIVPYILSVYDCIILEGFGVGGLPDRLRETFQREMQRYQPHEKLLIMATQVTYEGSSMDTYVVGRKARKNLPFLETYDMTLEAVFAKIMWILGLHIRDRDEMERLFYKKINYDIFRKD